MSRCFGMLLAAAVSLCALQAQSVSIQVDTAATTGPLKPIWSWFGYDEPNYTYMKDGKKLLSELSALSPVPVYVRARLTTIPEYVERRFGRDERREERPPCVQRERELHEDEHEEVHA